MTLIKGDGPPKPIVKELPSGRTLTYLIYRVCERFGQPVSWFYTLPQEDQTNLVAYDEIRRQEEIEIINANQRLGL